MCSHRGSALHDELSDLEEIVPYGTARSACRALEAVMTVVGRFLIVSWDGGGNVPPALNLGARLTRQGYRVRLLGWESMASYNVAGVEFTTYPSVPAWPKPPTLEYAWNDHVLPALHGPGTRDDIRNQVKDFRPDVLVVDCMVGAGLEVADTLGLPYAILVHVPYCLYMYEWGSSAYRAKKIRYLSKAGEVLVLLPPGFDAPCPSSVNTAYVGPITDPNSRSPLAARDAEVLAQPGHPWVLLSLSTTSQGQAAALPRILEAVAELPIRVLLTLGNTLPSSTVNLPGNVTLRGFIPHDLLLPHMAAVISHGGAGTITTALTAGVPLICIPQGRDQPYNSRRVVASGVGCAVAKDAPPVEIATAITELLADPGPLSNARRFADVINRLGRGDVAARKVASLLGPHASAATLFGICCYHSSKV
jgi:UDP:flavonoid glycosyltransferase YjiC (YdhE family)